MSEINTHLMEKYMTYIDLQNFKTYGKKIMLNMSLTLFMTLKLCKQPGLMEVSLTLGPLLVCARTLLSHYCHIDGSVTICTITKRLMDSLGLLNQGNNRRILPVTQYCKIFSQLYYYDDTLNGGRNITIVSVSSRIP